MNKHGFLLGEETVKIIIAVIAIMFLVYLLVSIYYNQSKEEDLEMAKTSLEYLKKEINSGSTTVEIYNPKGWWIASWPIRTVKPKECLGDRGCICICKEYDDGELMELGIAQISNWFLEGIAERCDEEGVCIEDRKNINVEPTILEPVPKSFEVNYGDVILIKQK
ncbi:MAG: hypothetical protein ABIH59_00530 [archaeon]